jgi:2-dehydropantoate 2-reductase
VVVLQNGVEHVERFAPYVPVERLVPAVIDCPAERTAPGRMRQRGPSWIVVPDTAHGRAFVPLFRRTNFDVSTGDFTTRAWAKLCINAPGAISAILMKPTGVIQIDPIAELTRGNRARVSRRRSEPRARSSTTPSWRRSSTAPGRLRPIRSTP